MSSTTRSTARPRRYVHRFWLLALRPLLRFSVTRDAFVLRGIGNRLGPVLRPDRRARRRRRFDGVERRIQAS
jgi:hypothetical protein